jgi:ABC-type dipeptide/oligopeptide/nickel transport system permease component
MLILYIIVAILLGMFAAYRYGQAPHSVQNEIGAILVFGVIFWPAVLALAVVIAPFAGMGYLGHRAKQKAIEVEKQKEVKA